MFKEKIKELVSKSDDGNNKKKIENLVFFFNYTYCSISSYKLNLEG